jgi:hypothetical protein
LLSTLPKDGKFKAAYAAASNLTVGLYEVIDGDHSYVITSNDGYAPDKDPVNFCVCDPWLGCAFSNLLKNLHYKGNVINITLSYEVMPEIKVGSYQFASISSDLLKFKGVMQILHSAFLTEFEKLQALQ